MTERRKGARLRLVHCERPDPADEQDLQNRIDRWNVELTGRRDWAAVGIFLRDGKDAIVGGITGDIWAGWLHVRVLWLDEKIRRRGWGSRLLEAAERVAREHGCSDVHLESFSFQAPDFYRKHGYEIFGRLTGYPEGYTNFFLRKRLRPVRPRRRRARKAS